MRKNLTEIVFILDRSGSMSGLETDTIGGFNSMIEKQKKENGEALISTVLFDNVSEVIHVPFPVSWTVKMKKKQKETQDILSYHTQAAGCSDKARAKASGGRQPIEECGRTGL